MSASKGPRFQFEIQLPSQESKANFSAVLDEAKRLMTPPGQRKLDNYRLLMSLIDLAKQRLPPLTQALESDLPPPRQLSWQESSGEVVVVYAYLYMYSNQKCVCHVINLRRACAARVTVVVLSVRLSVHILFSDYRLRDGL